MFKQVRSGWPKAIRSIQNSDNPGPMMFELRETNLVNNRLPFLTGGYIGNDIWRSVSDCSVGDVASAEVADPVGVDKHLADVELRVQALVDAVEKISWNNHTV